MKHLVFHFDFISPYAWLAFERLPQALEGLSVSVDYRPVLLAGLLQHWGSKGPAEIEPKRQWTFRHVHWLAAQQGTPLDVPAVHPFNPLPLLRLALACGPNRRVVEAIFRHTWLGGADAVDPARVAVLTAALAPQRDPNGADVKAELRQTTEAAAAAGLFGVPTVECEGRLFWGLDGLPTLRDALAGGAWFQGPGWHDAALPRPGVVRR
ncbi:MAG: disulfide bond formation protein DsbA [Leptothrix sp. (in: Bacteria)]|nr:disulfide bond formation protein DsbA [Leptothrix sp. (in: b-proteobacteria)]